MIESFVITSINLKKISLLFFNFILGLWFTLNFASISAHPSDNVLEECKLLAKYDAPSKLDCTISVSILFSNDLSKVIDSNSDKDFSNEEIRSWVDNKYLSNIKFYNYKEELKLDLISYSLPSYKVLVETPEKENINLLFGFNLPNNKYLTEEKSEFTFINNSNLDKSSTKLFIIDKSSDYITDLEIYDINNKFTLPVKKGNLTVPKEECKYGNLRCAGISILKGDYRFNSLINRDVTIKLFIFITLVGLLAGIAHSLTPGHGKALMSSILIARQSSIKHAIYLGVSITIAHTISVVILSIMWWLFKETIPSISTISIWITRISFVLIFLIGIKISLERYKELKNLDNNLTNSREVVNKNISIKSVISTGFANGISPCPEAIIILLASIALNKFILGLYVVFVFSIGMSITLSLIGIFILKFSNKVNNVNNSKLSNIIKFIPLIASIFIIALAIILLINTFN